MQNPQSVLLECIYRAIRRANKAPICADRIAIVNLRHDKSSIRQPIKLTLRNPFIPLPQVLLGFMLQFSLEAVKTRESSCTFVVATRWGIRDNTFSHFAFQVSGGRT